MEEVLTSFLRLIINTGDFLTITMMKRMIRVKMVVIIKQDKV